MTTSINKPPVWFWIVSVLALIWNGMGVNAYLQQAYNTDSYRAMYSKEQLEIAANLPAWVTAAFAIAVFCGALGCVALLIRKKWAYILFVLSAIGAIAQQIYLFMNVEMDGAKMIMPIMIILACLYLIWLSKKATAKGWIR